MCVLGNGVGVLGIVLILVEMVVIVVKMVVMLVEMMVITLIQVQGSFSPPRCRSSNTQMLPSHT